MASVAANSRMMSAILNSHFYYINVGIARRLITRRTAPFLQNEGNCAHEREAPIFGFRVAAGWRRLYSLYED